MRKNHKMKKYIILSEKKWHKELCDHLNSFFKGNWVLINDKDNLNLENLSYIKPNKIFIPHWSYIISSEIIEKYECIIFHMTDLPYGRGGSPMQNLILEGKNDTKITAIKATSELDAGPIYLKKDFSLAGTAEEIFIRGTKIVKNMIIEIIMNNIKPKPQKGKPTYFKRRKPEQSNIEELEEIEKIYDYIRMLDAEGYPKAFIETKYFKFEFSRANFKTDKTIIADVKISRK